MKLIRILKSIKKIGFVLFCLSGGLTSSLAQHKTYDLMPQPKDIKTLDGFYTLQPSFKLAIQGEPDSRLYKASTRFLRRLDGRTGLYFKQGFITNKVVDREAPLQIVVERPALLKLGEDESYELRITSQGISLKAATDFGAMHGLETILQLLEIKEGKYTLPCVEIKDAPRFPWRGLMIDVARHYQPVEVIKRNLDAMAAVKLNVFHFHLTDDQGFRVESKTHPKLHEKGSDGMYFTQAQVKEILAYSADLGIRVVPEFDVPGHATAWLLAYPELGSFTIPTEVERNAGIFDPTLDPTKERTYEILDELFGEMAALFPDPYFHIGGDENEGKDWDSNPKIVAFKKENNLADNHALQSHFNNRLLKSLTKHGKQMVGWDEIMQPDLPKNAVIQSWRGKEGLVAAAKNGYQVILSNGYYIDLMHPAQKHYVVDPIPENTKLTPEQQKNVLGGEATMWSELVTPATIDSRIWPRTAAIAERFWSPREVNDVQDMYRRLPIVCNRLEELGIQHLSSRDLILRNLTNYGDISALKRLSNVCEPMKGYTRNPGGKKQKTYNPFTLWADACVADASGAMKFDALVESFIANRSEEDLKAIQLQLSLWEANDLQVQQAIANSPTLDSIRSLSVNLKRLAGLGNEAIGMYKRNKYASLAWEKKSEKLFDEAFQQGGRTRLAVVNSFKKLIRTLTGNVQASFVPKAVRVDGNLTNAEWEKAHWKYFTPLKYYSWKDSVRFAVQWDKKNLYIAFEVFNENLQARKKKKDATGLEFDDGVEFLLDPQYNRSVSWEEDDIAYHVSVKNVVMDERGSNSDGTYNKKWNGKAKTAVKVKGTVNNSSDTDTGYTVEIAVPWKEIGREAKEGTEMGINFCLNDSDDTSHAYRYADYMYLPMFHKSLSFARLILIIEEEAGQFNQ